MLSVYVFYNLQRLTSVRVGRVRMVERALTLLVLTTAAVQPRMTDTTVNTVGTAVGV